MVAEGMQDASHESQKVWVLRKTQPVKWKRIDLVREHQDEYARRMGIRCNIRRGLENQFKRPS